MVEITGGCGYVVDGANVLIVDYDNIAETATDDELDADVRAWLELHNPNALPSRRETAEKTSTARIAELEAERDAFVIGAPDGTETPAPAEWARQNPKDAAELATLKDGGFACQGCGREESVCSADPCEGVKVDRES